MSKFDRLGLAVPCDYCGVEPGRWCRRRAWGTDTITGRASYLHTARTSPVYAAWRIGYGEAHRDLLDLAQKRDLAGVVAYLKRMLG